MADTNRQAPHNLEVQLDEEPFSFDFFQALRLLECIHSSKPRLGTSQRVGDDPIRLAHKPSLDFECSTIGSFEAGKKGEPARLTSRFLGLFGPNGPLPLHLTEYVRDRIRHHADPTIARFVDIFHHRMLCLFYRAWANTEPVVSYDRPESDKFGYYLGSLIGRGMESLRDRDCIEEKHKLYFAGLFSCQTWHADGLSAILKNYFKVTATIAEFVGEWIVIPEHELCRLGLSRSNWAQGQSIILGNKIWSRQFKFRIILGPLNFKQYCEFLPFSDRLRHLVALVRNYAGDELIWDINLVIKNHEIPYLRLDGKSMLGWTTWLGKPMDGLDVNDLVLNPINLHLDRSQVHKVQHGH